MNSNKYLTKNELKHFQNILEDAKISNKINDVISKEIIKKNDVIKPEIKDYLIKDLEKKYEQKDVIEVVE